MAYIVSSLFPGNELTYILTPSPICMYVTPPGFLLFRFQPVNPGILIHRRRWAMGIGFGSKDAAARGDPDL